MTAPGWSYGETDVVVREIKSERERQRNEEGWTPEHDDSHAKGEMARAAGCYALHAGQFGHMSRETYPMAGNISWPWSREWWKPKTPRRDLIRAAALIVAEIERLDRATVKRLADKLEASGAVIDPDLHGRLR
jgi:hypothetical protein